MKHSCMQGYNSHRGTTSVHFLMFSFVPEIYNHRQVNFFQWTFGELNISINKWKMSFLNDGFSGLKYSSHTLPPLQNQETCSHSHRTKIKTNKQNL